MPKSGGQFTNVVYAPNEVSLTTATRSLKNIVLTGTAGGAWSGYEKVAFFWFKRQ